MSMSKKGDKNKYDSDEPNLFLALLVYFVIGPAFLFGCFYILSELFVY